MREFVIKKLALSHLLWGVLLLVSLTTVAGCGSTENKIDNLQHSDLSTPGVPGVTPLGPSSTPVKRDAAPQSLVTSLPPSTTVLIRTASPSGATTELRHSLPDTQLIAAVPLLYQPDGLAIAPDKIPVGATVILLGRDESQSWYRVFWEDYFGWIPTRVTNFPPSKAIELRAPPPCARARSFRRGLDTEWVSSTEGQVAVVVDLYRSAFGVDFPMSTLQIEVNSVPVQGKERMVSSKGEFLTRGAVIPVTVKKQDRISVHLLTPSGEAVNSFATIFSVPDGCSFKE